MATGRQRAAARRNIKKAANAATRSVPLRTCPSARGRHWVNKEPRAPAGLVVLPDRAKALSRELTCGGACNDRATISQHPSD